MSYSPADAITTLVDPEALRNLVAVCQPAGTKAVLVGFNEYSKNIINLAPGQIVAVYDPEPWKQGITFRGVPVVPPSQRLDINKVVICDYSLVYDYNKSMRELYGPGIDVYTPPRLHYKSTDMMDWAAQDPFFRKALVEGETQAPASMMAMEKVRMLVELMHAGLRNPGGIVEMGVWQGGSCWYMAKLLASLGETRDLYMIDLFESHDMDRTATMCNDQIERQLAFYPHAHLMMGLVDDERILSQLRGKPLCFAHVDLGFIPKALEFVWDHLQPGSVLLLDNYGHFPAKPWEFDAFFADRDRHVIRFPWSEQGMVIR